MLAQVSHPSLTYSSGNMAANTTDPFISHNVLQDPMMPALKLIVIAYIADMVS